MSYGELYLPPERKAYNPTNGQFLKGHTPHNKGKRWSEWMSKRGQRKVMRTTTKNLMHRPKSRPDTAARCRVPVVAVRDDGTWCVLPYVGAAGEWVGGCRENVRRCCQCNQARHVNKKTGAVNTDHRYMGIRWYFETDNVWTEKIQR